MFHFMAEYLDGLETGALKPLTETFWIFSFAMVVRRGHRVISWNAPESFQLSTISDVQTT